MTELLTAIQVYSVRDVAEKDFKGTLRQIADMGYDGIELAGLYGHSPEYVRDLVKELGLTPISAHVPYAELIGDTEGTIAKYATIGCPYIAVPYLTEELRPASGNFDEAVTAIRKIGEACKRNNITLLYHNHDFEFERMPDGRYGLDYLYQSVESGLLQTEIDTCWVKVSGLDPAEYIRQYAGRCPLVHMKDFVGQKSANMYQLIGLEKDEAAAGEAFEFRAVGHGCQDFPAIIKAASESGALWQIVEQDLHNQNSSIEDARLSIEFLKSL